MSAAASAMGATCFQVSRTSRFCSGVIALLMLALMRPWRRCGLGVVAASVGDRKALDLLAGQIGGLLHELERVDRRRRRGLLGWRPPGSDQRHRRQQG